jgi:diguanylate cyclase (GGDEF)-like protein/PAS domain S-box-containing protein
MTIINSGLSLANSNYEQLFKTLFEQPSQFIAILSPEGRVEQINNVALQWQDATREDYIGSLFWQSPSWVNILEAEQIWKQRLAAASNQRSPIITQDTYQIGDGSIRHADASTTAIYDPQNGVLSGYIYTAVDTTKRRINEGQIQKSEERLRFALEHNNIGGWELNLIDQTSHRSLLHDKIFGYDTLQPNWNFKNFIEHVIPEDRNDANKKYQEAIASKTDWHIECRIRRQDGVIRWILAAGGHEFDSNGRVKLMAGIVRDITEQKQMEESLRNVNEKLEIEVAKRTYDLTMTNAKLEEEIVRRQKLESELVDEKVNLEEAQRIANLGSWQLDIQSGKVVWSEALFKMYGFDPKQSAPLYSEHSKLFTPASWAKLSATVSNTIKTGLSYELELETVHEGRKNRWMWARGKAIRNDKGVTVAVNGIAQDITERKEAEEKIHHLAMTDHLTGLANRTQFSLRFQQSMQLANREELSLALMMLDVDKFKPVNDSYGHPTGDAVLESVASILKRFTRETDVVSRLGGDEFAILFVNPKDKNSVGKNAQSIIDEVKKPITIMGNTIQIGISIGVAFYPTDALNQEELFKLADAALYKAKVGGRGIFAFH